MKTQNKGGKEIASIVASELNGFIVFRGVILHHTLREEGGFLVGDIFINGIDEYNGQNFRIWVKNENIFAWKNDKPIIMPPDLIIVLDDNGFGVINSKITVGLKVTVIGCSCSEYMKNK